MASRGHVTRLSLALFLFAIFALVVRWQWMQILALLGMALLGAGWVALEVVRSPDGGIKPAARSGHEAGAFAAIGVTGLIVSLMMPGATGARTSIIALAVIGFSLAASWLFAGGSRR
jgi:hypothetical protein